MTDKDRIYSKEFVEMMQKEMERQQQYIVDLERQLATLEAALKEIAEHEHCKDGSACFTPHELGNKFFYRGCELGHRCAAAIASKALKGGVMSDMEFDANE